MIFRQMFDSVSSPYTYLLASRAGGEGRPPSDVHRLPRQSSKTPIALLLLTGGRSGR